LRGNGRRKKIKKIIGRREEIKILFFWGEKGGGGREGLFGSSLNLFEIGEIGGGCGFRIGCLLTSLSYKHLKTFIILH
jgi:hypothetical protein